MPDESFEERRRAQDEAQRRRLERMEAVVARSSAAALRRRELLKQRFESLAQRMERAGFKGRRRKRSKDQESGGVPAVPDRPLNLSGGAAAELDFDRDG